MRTKKPILTPEQVAGLKEWEQTVRNTVDHQHKVLKSQARKAGASTAELDKLEAEFQSDRPRLIQAEQKARMDAYPQTRDGKEMARLSGEADLAYRERMEQESQQQQ